MGEVVRRRTTSVGEKRNSNVGARQRDWAHRARAALVAQLGGKCVQCGTSGTKKNPVEIDCRTPKGDRHHRIEQSSRISFYRAQMREENLQLLCKRHHGQKSQKEIGWNRSEKSEE